MCGRYTLIVTWEELMEMFGIEDAMDYPLILPRFNMAPTQMGPVIISHGGRNRMGQLRWGLIPAWAKDEKIGFQTINAKAESLRDKPAFRTPFQRKRCLIPADGYYEWQQQGSVKQPYRIVVKDCPVFAFAGLYDTWLSPDGKKISTYTIITTAANSLTEKLHPRMPVILPREHQKDWLDSSASPADLTSLLVPYDSSRMDLYPVSPAVGNVRNEGPELIHSYQPNKEKTDPPPVQLTLDL
ncbi:SOS response-associated peptidase [Paenibacillus sp. YN15]|uniref:SOS response-associated peptidase n=1 Tax=Paenibacillus sp. YN15 TaxID=1742774 RepID=UPI000DCE8FF4|nr:SOS response-associated peptidase [Paenibacillus sp. YN15]RAV00569.1 SOS response-associated peptidase [Paenibacillus sp. YN15]